MPTAKKFRPTKYSQEEIWIHEIPNRRNLDPRNTQEKKFGPTKARWHNDTSPMRPTEFSTLKENQSPKFNFW